jgi:DNA-directed RNA polymerase subunit RPC12/RpoP
MNTVSPAGAEVYLYYVCPHCGIQHILKRRDTQFGKIVCECQKTFRIKRVEKINLAPVYHKTAEEKRLDRCDAHDIMNEAADALIAYGYIRAKSRPKLKALTKKNKYQYRNKELLMLDFLRGEMSHGE